TYDDNSPDCTTAGGPSGTKVGAELTPPRTTEVLFGVDRALPGQVWLGGEFIYRRLENAYEDVETNAVWDSKGTSVVSYKDPTAGFVYELRTPEEAFRRYYGFTLNVRKKAGRARILGSWTVSRSEGTYADSTLSATTGWSYFFNSPFLDNP